MLTDDIFNIFSSSLETSISRDNIAMQSNNLQAQQSLQLTSQIARDNAMQQEMSNAELDARRRMVSALYGGIF